MTLAAKRNVVGHAFLCLFASVLTAAAPAEPPARTWRDATGKFEIDAVYVKSDETTVDLRRTDGKTVTVPIDKLSFSDRVLIKKYARVGNTTRPTAPRRTTPRRKPITVGSKVKVQWGATWYDATVLKVAPGKWFIHYDGWAEDDVEWVTADRIRTLDGKPLITADADSTTAKPDTTPVAPDAAPPIVKLIKIAAAPAEPPLVANVDGTGARTLNLQQDPDQWSLNPDPAPAAPPAAQPVLLGRKLTHFDRATDLMYCPNQGCAMVMFANKHPAKTRQGRILICDLGQGRVLKTMGLRSEDVLVSLSPSGRRLLTRPQKFDFDNQDRLDLYAVESGTLRPMIRFQPFGDREGYSRKIRRAELIDDEHLLVVNHDYELAVWRVPEAKLLFTAETPMFSEICLSPGNRYFAVSIRDRVAFVDPLKGEVLAHIPTGLLGMLKLAIRADGKRLALWRHGRLRVWDLTDGNLVSDFPLPVNPRGYRLEWIGADHILLDGKYLIDVPRRIVLWQYDGAGERHILAGNKLCYVGKGPTEDSFALGVATVLHDEALRLAESLEPATLLAVKPGDRITLDANVHPLDKDQVLAILRKKLEENGCTVTDGQTRRLVARCETGKPYDVRYRAFGRDGEVTTRLTEQILRLSYEVDGKIVWETKTHNRPPSALQLKKGQTIQQAAEEAAKPHASFYQYAWLPKYIARHPEGEEDVAYGRSKVGS